MSRKTRIELVGKQEAVDQAEREARLRELERELSSQNQTS
jgi:hypothetical protein